MFKKARGFSYGLTIAVLLIGLLCLSGTGWTAPAGGSKAPASGSSLPPANSRNHAVIELSWEGAGDLDLEIWSEDGRTYLFSAYDYGSPDLSEGGSGVEYIIMEGKPAGLTEYGQNEMPARDLSRGGWIISIGNPVDSIDCYAVVTITFPNGERDVYEYEMPGTAWHWDVCQIYPRENRTIEIDRVYYESCYGSGESSSSSSGGYAYAELSWEGAGDLDLEIWNESGGRFLVNAYDYESPDITNGRDGSEYIVFDRKSEIDLTEGGWTITVSNGSLLVGNRAYDCAVTVRVVLPNGQERVFTTAYDAEVCHWDVCRIYPEENDVERVDEFYYEFYYN